MAFLKKYLPFAFLLLVALILMGLAVEFKSPLASFLGTQPWDFLKNTFIALGAIFTLIFAFWRNKTFSKQINEISDQTKIQTKSIELQAEAIKLQADQVKNQTRTLNLEDEKRLDAQYAEAVKILGNNETNFTAKLGAVYVLTRLAIKSPDHAQQCIDLLCSLNEWMFELSARDFGNLRWDPVDYFGKKGDDEWLNGNRDWPEHIEKFLEKNKEAAQADLKNAEDWMRKIDKQTNRQERENISRKVILELSKILRHYYLKEYSDSDTSNRKEPPLFDLSNKALTKINLPKVKLINCDFKGALLIGANLSYANLSRANLEEANLSFADLLFANLSYANLSYTSLSRANLSGAKLSGALLFHTNLTKAYLILANLEKANLEKANLSEAILSSAILSSAILSEATLSDATLSDASLSGATLSGANLFLANLSATKLRNTKSVENVTWEKAWFTANTELPFSHEEAKSKGMLFCEGKVVRNSSTLSHECQTT